MGERPDDIDPKARKQSVTEDQYNIVSVSFIIHHTHTQTEEPTQKHCSC